MKTLSTVKPPLEEFPDEAKRILLETLAQVPFVGVVEDIHYSRYQTGRIDYAVRLETPDFNRTLIVEYKSRGEPRIVREVADRFAYHGIPPGAVPLFIAPYISPQSASILTERGISYLDLAGNCRIAFDYVFIFRAGHENPAPERRRLGTLYSPKAERILRVFLNDPGKVWKVEPLAEEAGVSLGQVSKVKQLLEDREWLKSEAAGSRLVMPKELLTEWSVNYRYKRHEQREFYSLESIPDIERHLASICLRVNTQYALTGLAAAARYAPYARYQRMTAYVESPEAAQKLAAEMSLKTVPTGENVVLLIPYDEGVFYGSRDLDGQCLVSPIQCYIDLKHTTSRGNEAAEFLKEQVIIPTW